MQSEPTTHEIELLRAMAGEIFIDSWGSWMTEAAESLKARGYCTGAPNYHVTEAGVAFLARMKEPTPFRFVYRNHRGEVAERRVIPDAVRFGTTEWHPTPQWLLRAYDLDKQALREFAMSEISSVLANRKEVMPHTAEQPARPVQGCSSPRRDTTPPQASEPGATDRLLAGLSTLATHADENEWPRMRATCADAASEIRRLRAVEAEQAARIAALEAGLRLLKDAHAPGVPHSAKLYTLDDGSRECMWPTEYADYVAARLLNLPQEGK